MRAIIKSVTSRWSEKNRANKIIDTLLVLSFLAFIGTFVWAIIFKW